ncbi:uncharacterized protein BKCO1_6800028 [Diplodia corticola]|uniref:HNH nuclease domain-containing protein n=1 Tax=Diplodia corticola TaxID=236234 RepID=A0A1J9QNG9_9PEZI|nr:uncharacterized protein BKCO1_6800028 [Diplodia corticola]OJD30001.1 hypothetical protein BKCO1_6800028 [Diplodia corticola]
MSTSPIQPNSPAAAASHSASPEISTALQLELPQQRSTKTESKYKHRLERSREASEEALHKYCKLSQGSAPEASRHNHALNLIESATKVLKAQQSEAALRVESLTAVAEKAVQRKLTNEEFMDVQHDIYVWTRARTSQEIFLRSAESQRNSIVEQLAELPAEKTQKVLEMLLCVPIMQRRRSRPSQAHWRKAAVEYYDAQRQVPFPAVPPSNPTSKPQTITVCWDPIMRAWYPANEVKAAHILPYSMTNEVLQMILGEGEGAEVLLDIRNCLLLWEPIEAAFDKGIFVLVPDQPAAEGQTTEYKLVLLDESYRTAPVKFGVSTTWSKLDGIVLEFRNECRPRQRYMYLNFASRIIAARKLQFDTYSRSRLESTGSAWVSPGKWIRKSMIREVARIVGDHQVADTFEEASFEDQTGPDGPTKSRVTKAAEEWITGTFERRLFERPLEKGEDGGSDEDEDEDAED